jgi:putative glycosyltransferase
MKLSIVSTLYRSAPHLLEFHSRMSSVATEVSGDNYEIILVNDGSPDNSLEIAVELTRSDSHVFVIDLSRNFGHHKAMMTGLKNSSGDYIYLIDSDLEEQPEWLISFMERMHQHDCDLVYGIQAARKGGLFERLTGPIFYRFFRFCTNVNQPDNIVTARLMTRRYVNSLTMHEERELNIGGLYILTGYKQCYEPVVKLSLSPTTYTISAKFRHFIDAITSFSSLPLVFTFYVGLLISLLALIYIGMLIARYFFIAAPPDGYTSLLASIWLFSGLIIFFVGIQGIYIAKLYSEVKRRPYTIVRHIYKDGI